MRKQIFCLVALLFFFAAKAPAQQAPPATQVIVIRAGKLTDVDAGKANKTPADFLGHHRDLGEIQRRDFTGCSRRR